jgi:tetratricopeptide (TPR) repeat protein
VALDPHLADAHYGLAKAHMKRGFTGLFGALGDVGRALFAPTGTAKGRHFLFSFLVAVGFLTLLATATGFAIVMLLRHGALMRHDLEEALGPGARRMAPGVFAVFLLVPLMTLNGYAWLPLWCIAVLFVYLGAFEKVIAALFIALTLLVGPLTQLVAGRTQAQQNPLLRASLLAIEGGPDSRAIADLQGALAENADDYDLSYLLALEYKKAGRYDEAAAIYRKAIEAAPKDPLILGIALNNLGNIEFSRGEFLPAISRYKRAIDTGSGPAMTATYYYNLSLAHLQRFEYEPTNEARSAADRLDRAVTQGYETLWKADRRGSTVSAVVDLAPSADEVWAKFNGRRQGVGQKNVTGRGASPLAGLEIGAVANRFTGFAALVLIVVALIGKLRGGDRSSTQRCQKCGAAFCRKCQLGTAVDGLCTQCYHLFVIRDGVSGPARSQKLTEVQGEEERRARVFRMLSLVAPGSGQLYGQKTFIGMVLLLVWSGLIMLLVMGGRLPVTETPAALTGWWTPAMIVLGLILVYVLGNKLTPDFDYVLPVSQRPQRRMAKAS